MLQMNFKSWFLVENTVIQSLNKQLAKLQDKGIVIDEDLKNKIRNVQNEYFHFLTDEKKKKEIFDWMLLQCINDDDIADVLDGAKPTLNKDLFDSTLNNLSLIMRQSRDYLVSKYESINFKDPKFNRYKLREENQKWHQELSRSSVVGTKGAWGKPIIKFPDGWSWVNLGKSYCPIESATMGHCGNSGGSSSDRILSLRDNKNVPHLTFIDTGDGKLGEMKGRHNSKPEKKYHPYIVELLKSDYVKKLIGGGYAEESNFDLNDLGLEEKEKLLALKPSLSLNIEDVVKRLPSAYNNYHGIADLRTGENTALLEFLLKNNLVNEKGELKYDLPNTIDDPLLKNYAVYVAPRSRSYFTDAEGNKISKLFENDPIDEFMAKDYIYNVLQHIKKYFYETLDENPDAFISALFNSRFKIPLWLIKEYADYLNKLSLIRSQSVTARDEIKILYSQNRESFDELFGLLNKNNKSDTIAFLLRQHNYKLDEKYLKFLSQEGLSDIYHTFAPRLFPIKDRGILNQRNITHSEKTLEDLKSMNRALYDMIEKNILFPIELEKERYHSLIHNPDTRPQNFLMIKPSYLRGSKGDYERHMTGLLRTILTKIFNNEELSEEDIKIMKNNFNLEVKNVKEIQSFFHNFLPQSGLIEYDDESLNKFLMHLIIKLNHFYDYYDIINLFIMNFDFDGPNQDVLDKLATKLIENILEKINTFSAKTKKIMLKFADEILREEEEAHDKKKNKNATLPYIDYEDYILLKDKRNQIKEKYHI